MTDVVLISGEKRERVFVRDTLSEVAEEGTTVEFYGENVS